MSFDLANRPQTGMISYGICSGILGACTGGVFGAALGSGKMHTAKVMGCYFLIESPLERWIESSVALQDREQAKRYLVAANSTALALVFNQTNIIGRTGRIVLGILCTGQLLNALFNNS